MPTADYEITVRIRVRASGGPFDDPVKIAEDYANMAKNYRSIGASEATVVEVREVTK